MRFKFKINVDNTISHHQNRGMDLEDEINKTNEFYRLNEIALVYKRHTPIKVVRCRDKKITEAYFDEPSTTDYYGVYKGKYIDFEAKETSSTTVFPLANLRDNQIEHIKNVIQNGGISNEIFLEVLKALPLTWKTRPEALQRHGFSAF